MHLAEMAWPSKRPRPNTNRPRSYAERLGPCLASYYLKPLKAAEHLPPLGGGAIAGEERAYARPWLLTGVSWNPSLRALIVGRGGLGFFLKGQKVKLKRSNILALVQ